MIHPPASQRETRHLSMQNVGLPIAGILLCAAMTGLAVASLRDLDKNKFLLVINVLLALAPFAIAVIRRRFDIFEPAYMFSAIFAVFFVIRPVFDLTDQQGIPSMLGQDASARYTDALQLSTWGGAAFILGYYSAIGKNISSIIPSSTRTYFVSNLVLAYGFCLMVIGLVFILLVQRSGGISGFLYVISGRSQTRREIYTESSGYLYMAPTFSLGLGLLLVAISRPQQPIRLATGISLCLFSLIMDIGAGNRSYIVPVVMSLVILFYLKSSRRPKLWVLGVVALPLAIVLITVPRTFRYLDARDGTFWGTLKTQLVHPSAALRETFQGLDTAMILGLSKEIEYVPSRIDYQWGLTFINSLARPIPRSIWEGKPRSGDEQLMQQIWPEYWDRGIQFYFSILGDPYLNFGVFGVVGFMIVFGTLWRALYTWYRQNNTDPVAMSIYAASLPFMIVYLRGGVGVDYQRQVIVLAPILLVAWFSRDRHPKGAG